MRGWKKGSALDGEMQTFFLLEPRVVIFDKLGRLAGFLGSPRVLPCGQLRAANNKNKGIMHSDEVFLRAEVILVPSVVPLAVFTQQFYSFFERLVSRGFPY